jgi:hypothetical protein
MTNQAGSDGVLDPVRAYPDRLQYRLGLQFRLPRSPSAASLPARYVRVQIASPPPHRIGGERWRTGLLVKTKDGTRDFDPDGSDWTDFEVFPKTGIPGLATPDPETLVFDQWIAVPAVPATRALTSVFTLTAPGLRGAPANHFLSVGYVQPVLGGAPLDVAGVSYYRQDILDFEFDRTAKEWLAISFDLFRPGPRDSADYIVKVETPEGIGPQDGQFAPVVWW